MPNPSKRHKKRVVIGYDPDGAPIIKWATAATAEELERRIQLLKSTYATGADQVVHEDIPFGQYAAQWFSLYPAGMGAVKASTLQGYRSALNHHILPRWGSRIIRTIKPMELQAWINGYTGRRDGTVRSILLVTRQIFSQAYTDGVIDRNPMAGVRKPRTVEAQRQEVPVDQLCRLHQAAEAICPDCAALLFFIPYYTGLRRGEALGLTGQDLDFTARIIHVRQEVTYVGGRTLVYRLEDGDTLKTEAAARDVPMPAALARILRPYATLGSAPLIHGRNSGAWMCESTYKRAWGRLIRQAGLEGLPREDRITPHRLRHTYSSMTRRAQLDIKERQYIMGHAAPEITEGRYTHINDDDKQRILQKLDRIFDAR